MLDVLDEATDLKEWVWERFLKGLSQPAGSGDFTIFPRKVAGRLPARRLRHLHQMRASSKKSTIAVAPIAPPIIAL